MNTNDLRIFEAVAAHNSFTKAAEATFTVQSNVTARIRSLEEEFGAALFERNARKVKLTQAGEVLMHYSKQIGHLVELAKQDMTSPEVLTGSLKIGCIETTMALQAPDLLKRFAELHPQVELEFISAMRADLIKGVLNYRLDAAFVPGPLSTAELRHEPIGEEQLVIAGHGDMTSLKSLLKKGTITRIIVFDQGCVFRERLESWLSAQGITEYKPIVVNSLEGVVNFVEAGLGIAMLPKKILARFFGTRHIKTFSVNKELGTMGTVLVSRSNVPVSAVLEEFMKVFRDALKRSPGRHPERSAA